MSKNKAIKTCGECRKHNIDCSATAKASACDFFEQKVTTNGDKIRRMPDEELAKKFGYPCPPLYKKHCRGDNPEECAECWLDWLKQGAKDE